MNQTPAERLEIERKLSENQFDITQYEHVPRRYYGRMFFATLIVIVLAALLRAFANGQIEWSYIGQFLTSEAILWGLVNTIVMSILAMALGVVIGVITAIMRMSANPILRYVAITYTWLFRGTPLILQLLLWFNLALIFPVIAIPGLFSIDTVDLMTPFVAALLGLSINQAPTPPRWCAPACCRSTPASTKPPSPSACRACKRCVGSFCRRPCG